MPLTAGTRLGPYEIVAAIGAGGMGEVYRAKDTRLERDVAIKVLPAHLAANPEFKQRLEREGRAVAALNHPHICALYDIGHQDGVDFLVLEYLEGETLAARLAKGALAASEVLRCGVQIADALDKAHRKGFTHRDLKPGNIMLTKAGAKLLDFGLAKSGAPPQAAGLSALPTKGASLTIEGAVLGTIQYMAPEQLEGKEVDARSDLFAFGAVLYEMATAEKAFPGSSHATIIAAIMTAEPKPMSPAALDRLVKKCLAKDRDERWQSARDLMTQLEWMAEAREAPAPAEPAPQRAVSGRLVWAALAALLLIAATAVAVSVVHFREPAPEVAKLALLPPEKTTFNAIAISPDGRRVAISGAGADGRRLLWVRPLHSLSAQPLAGTEPGSHPFWSPDSRWIGFFADSKLKKIDVTGGPPQTVCAAPGLPGGGTWNRDGVILFSSTGAEGIRRVPAAGGESKLVISLDKSRQERSIRFPYFLPDGRHFLFLARSSQAEHQAIYAAALDSPERKRMLSADLSVAYADAPSGPGYLLFLREGTLMAQPFDASKLETVGDPVPVAEQVGAARGPGRANFSVSRNGVLVYDSSGSGGSMRPTWLDRAGRQLEAVAEPAYYLSPSLSPEEKRVVIERYDSQAGTFDLWLWDLARGAGSRFTFDPAGDRNPVWSPDGSRILFASNRAGVFNLYVKISSGAGADELLLKTDQTKYPEDWSSDGRLIAFAQQDPKTKNDLWVLPLEGPEGAPRKPAPYLQTEFNEQFAKFSPDGRWIVYTSDESTRDEVYVQPYPVTGAKWMISKDGGVQPRWRRDGKELFYISSANSMMAVEVKLPGKGEAGFQAGVPKPLFQAPRSAGNAFPHYSVTADGQRFLMLAPMSETDSSPATVVLNWQAGLRR